MANEEGTLARLKAHRRELIDPKIAEHRGRIVKTTGDSLLVESPASPPPEQFVADSPLEEWGFELLVPLGLE